MNYLKIMKLRHYISISSFLHITLAILCILHGSNGDKKGGGNGQANDGTGSNGSRFKGAQIKEEVIPKDRPTEVTIIETEKKSVVPKKHKKIKSKKECPGKWYGGIGIQSDTNSIGLDVIFKVFPGYPADLAGLRTGDIIITTQEDEIIGNPGTILHITTNRGSYAITRGKICY